MYGTTNPKKHIGIFLYFILKDFFFLFIPLPLFVVPFTTFLCV